MRFVQPSILVPTVSGVVLLAGVAGNVPREAVNFEPSKLKWKPSSDKVTR